MKQSVAIMDLGTSRITVLIGSRGINSSITIEGIGVCEYAGYAGGQWLNPANLSNAVVQAIAGAENSARLHVSKIYVGVPNDFSMCKVNDVSISLNKRRKVTQQDVDTLLDSGNKFTTDLDWKVVNIQPIYFTLDDERKLVDAVGMASTRLGGSISYIMARTDFIEAIDAAVTGADIPETEYFSTALAEIMYLFDDYRRDRGVMLADVGNLGTSLTIGRGDGVARQYFFAWGGARITATLAEHLKISMREAERLKRKVILSLDPSFEPPEGESAIFMQKEYVVDIDNEQHSYPVDDVNAVVRSEIERFARYVKKALKSCDYPYPPSTPLSLTGGGLNYMRGAAPYLSECLEREVEPVKPSMPMYDHPQLSAPLGLMDVVLSNDIQPRGLFSSIRSWFRH